MSTHSYQILGDFTFKKKKSREREKKNLNIPS